MKKIKRMCLFLIKGSFTLLHSGLSPLDLFLSFFLKKNNPFLRFSPGLTCHLVVFQEHMTSDFDSNLAALTNTNSYCLSRASSPRSDAPLFFSFSASLFLSVSLYCWWKAAETTWFSVWYEKTRQAERDRKKVSRQKKQEKEEGP